MDKHTPGPWHYIKSYPFEEAYNGGEHLILDSGGFVVALTNYDTLNRNPSAPTYLTSEADARLIAAAPELLAALETLLESADRGVITEGDCAQARAAIATAKGE
jgi:hypothetical protein